MEGKLNFHGEESNERRKRGGAFPIGTIYFFRLASQKRKLPPNATFRKILDAVLHVDTRTLMHAFYRSSNVSFSPTFALYRFSRLKASKVQESKPRTRFSKSFPALVIVANYGIVLLARRPSSTFLDSFPLSLLLNKSRSAVQSPLYVPLAEGTKISKSRAIVLPIIQETWLLNLKREETLNKFFLNFSNDFFPIKY